RNRRTCAQRKTVGYSCIVRLQAARHSAFVMCVAASKKPMQSARLLPPPPGALGADSLGLPDDAPGDSARPLAPVDPPVANCVGSCGESGAMACGWGATEGSDDAALVEGLGIAGAAGGGVVIVTLG